MYTFTHNIYPYIRPLLVLQKDAVIGKRSMYADIVLYQILHDEESVQDKRKGLEGYKRRAELVHDVEERPNIKALL
jgi:hypothetical protein